MVDRTLSDCVIAYVGVAGRVAADSRDERVIALAGARGLDLLPTVTSIVDAVYSADPPLWNYATVKEVANAVERFLQERHPDLSPEALHAVANKFSFDWK